LYQTLEEALSYLSIPKVLRTSDAREYLMQEKNEVKEEPLMVHKMQNFVRKQVLKGKH
jgi:hypothetical protein